MFFRAAKRLTEEQLRDMMASASEDSEEDPDFVESVGENNVKAGIRTPRRPAKREAPVSSDDELDPDDPDEPDPDNPHKSKTQRPGKSKGPSKRSTGRPMRQSSSWAPVVGVEPPTAPNPVEYKNWNRDVSVMEPARQSEGHKYYCCVRGCASANVSDKDGLWLFAMPDEEALMSSWDERLPINYERNRPLSPRVCFRHFDKADFVRRQQRLVGLQEKALPKRTEFPDSSSSVPVKRLDYTNNTGFAVKTEDP